MAGSRSSRRRRYRRRVSGFTSASVRLLGRPPAGMARPTVDHLLPVSYCFSVNIPAFLAGSVANLRWVSLDDNVTKGRRVTAEGRLLERRWESEGVLAARCSRAPVGGDVKSRR